jgi:4-carboxymuconolactone decarboxylase
MPPVYSVEVTFSGAAYANSSTTGECTMSAQTEMLGGRLPLLDPATLSTAQKETYERLDLQETEQKQTSLNHRVREVVILAVGAVWKSSYNLYAHGAAARKLGISEDAIRALTTGGLSNELTDQEKIAYRFARQLSAEHRIDATLYSEAEHAFGQRGLVEITYLIGIYHTVCALLNAFEIPAPGSQIKKDAPTPRLGLVDPDHTSEELAETLKLLPVINVFRALANAESLYPTFGPYMAKLFKPLELDKALERMIVLRVAKRSDCLYAWRQNVVVAHSVGVTDEQIAALDNGDVGASCFTSEQQAAFAFSDEVMDLIEVTDKTYAAAKQHFSDRALTEILYVVGTYMFISRVVRTGHVPLDDEPAPSPQ